MTLLLVFAVWPRLVPDLRDVPGRGDLQRLLRPADRLPAPSGAAAGDRRARAHRPVFDRHALVDRRDAGGGVRHDRAAKGILDRNILRRHAMPNAMLPMATLIAINLGYVVAGAITVEVVFNWPGLGTLTVDALTARDYPVLQGDLRDPVGLGRLRQPRRRSRLPVPRPAGQGMTTPGRHARPGRPAGAGQRRGRRGDRRPPPDRPAAERPVRDRDPRLLHVPGALPDGPRRTAPDGDDRDGAASWSRRSRATRWAPTSSAGASST